MGEASWGKVVDFGPLQYGQMRSCAVKMHIPKSVDLDGKHYLDATLVYGRPGHGDGCERRLSLACYTREVSADAIRADAQMHLVNVGMQCLKEYSQGNTSRVSE